ncbi:VapE domain-containing protein [Comamonas sp.]|uniref:VapE domain-containing protein n=1 Tax=Comamonas sp. TaxID=34028 RepID=UPI0028A96043|nr:VapE domain-containing protein [Comamonas sp.]
MSDRYEEARRLLSAGIKLCELYPMSKQPKGDDWNHRLLTDPSQVRDTAGGYGIPLLANGLCSVDFDNTEVAERGLRACGLDPDWLRGCGVATSSTRPGSGGRVAFKMPAGANLRWLRFTNPVDGTILELRATSANLQDCMPGTTYSSKDGSGPWVQDYAGVFTFDTAPEPPKQLLDWWVRMSTDLEFLHSQQLIIAGAQAQLDVSSGATLWYASPHRMQFNMDHSVAELLLEHGYSEKNGRFAPPSATGMAGVRQIPGKDDLWQSDHASDPLFGLFDAWSAYVTLAHGRDLAAAEAVQEAGRALVALDGFESVEPVIRVLDDGTPVDDPGDLPAFDRDKTGKAKAIINNLLAALKHPGVTGVHIGHDSFRDEIMLAPAGTEQWRTFTDADYVRLRAQLELGRNGFAPIGRETMRDAVLMVAAENTFDSAMLWLGQQRWDGVRRIDTFLVDLFGAEDTPYARAVSEYLWTAMAGRVLHPGCKADMVPILVGNQGLGKSTAIAALVPSIDFFAEVSFAESDDNLSRKMRGKLVAEIAELKGLHSRDMETVKAFVTRTHEKWIPKYREFETTFPRRLVFVGTTNKDQFLADDTGNRRWLPIRVGDVDVAKIRQIAAQCWAEAAIRFEQVGVAWQQAQALAVDVHEEFSFHDEWEDKIVGWIAGGMPELENPADGLPTSEVLRLAIGFEGRLIKRSDEMRAASVLKKIGFKSARVSVNGSQTRRWLPTSDNLCLPFREVGKAEKLF